MHILVVMNDRDAARCVERHCREWFGRRIEALRPLGDFQKARDYLGRTPIDLLVLDVDDARAGGFRLLEDTPSESFQTIVLSADTAAASRAFAFGVLDFLEKPIRRPAMMRALGRLDDLRGRAAYSHRAVCVRRRGGMQVIPLPEILYAKGAGAYSEIMLRDGRTVLHHKSLEKLLALLPAVFERIHKSYVVNMEIVTNLLAHEGSRYEVLLQSGQRLPVGRTRVRRIRSRLEGVPDASGEGDRASGWRSP